MNEVDWSRSERVFGCPWFQVERAGNWHRITGCAGAVCVALRPDGGVVMVEVFRPATGRLSLELPRGGAAPGDDGPAATALRELREETGYIGVPHSAHVLGRIHPDQGLLAHAVDVVQVRTGAEPVAARDDEAHSVRVMRPEEIRAALLANEITCGITMAALALALPPEAATLAVQ